MSLFVFLFVYRAAKVTQSKLNRSTAADAADGETLTHTPNKGVPSKEVESADSRIPQHNKEQPHQKGHAPSQLLATQYAGINDSYLDQDDLTIHHSTMCTDNASLPSQSKLNFDDIMKRAKIVMDSSMKR